MYCLRLFIVVLQELHCLLQCLLLLLWCVHWKVCVYQVSSWLVVVWVSYMAILCPYRNVWPEAVYCCFTRTTLFTKHLTWRCAGRHGVLSVCKVSFLNSVRFLRYVSWNWRRRRRRRRTTTTTRRKWRIVKMNFYNFNNFPVIRFWSFFEDPHILTIGTLLWRRIPDWVPIATETWILRMYGSDAGQPVPSL